MSTDGFTHYIPEYVSVRWPTAACGRSARFVDVEHSAEPTCARCKAWLEASPSEIEALTTAWANEPVEAGQ